MTGSINFSNEELSRQMPACINTSIVNVYAFWHNNFMESFSKEFKLNPIVSFAKID